jgi:acetate kinase
MRLVLAAVERGDPDAVLALDVYVHRLRAGIAAMAAAMDGMDALTFTGGVGERSAPIRERACDGLGFLRVALDREKNANAKPDCEITAADARGHVLVVEAREDLQIAHEVRSVLNA